MGMTYCKKDSAQLVNGICPVCGTLYTCPQIFASNDELYISSLGKNYMLKFMRGQPVNEGFAVLSDKRVYFRGTTFMFTNGRFVRTYESRSVDVADVSGTSVMSFDAKHFRVISIISFALAGAFLLIQAIVASLGGSNVSTESDKVLGYGVIAILIAVGVLLLNLGKPRSYIKIDFAGGSIGFPANWYTDKESERFQRKLINTRDKARGQAPPNAAQKPPQYSRQQQPQYSQPQQPPQYSQPQQPPQYSQPQQPPQYSQPQQQPQYSQPQQPPQYSQPQQPPQYSQPQQPFQQFQQTATPKTPPSQREPADELAKYADMLEKGYISREEFEVLKKKLFSKMN